MVTKTHFVMSVLAKNFRISGDVIYDAEVTWQFEWYDDLENYSCIRCLLPPLLWATDWCRHSRYSQGICDNGDRISWKRLRAPQRLCSRLTALWRYINFVLYIKYMQYLPYFTSVTLFSCCLSFNKQLFFSQLAPKQRKFKRFISETWFTTFKHCLQQSFTSTFDNFDKSMSKQVIKIWSKQCHDLTLQYACFKAHVQ